MSANFFFSVADDKRDPRPLQSSLPSCSLAAVRPPSLMKQTGSSKEGTLEQTLTDMESCLTVYWVLGSDVLGWGRSVFSKITSKSNVARYGKTKEVSTWMPFMSSSSTVEGMGR